MNQSPNIQVRIEKRRQLALQSKRKRLHRPPHWLHPIPVEREYAKFLLLYVDKIKELVDQVFLPALPGLVQEASALLPRTDDINRLELSRLDNYCFNAALNNTIDEEDSAFVFHNMVYAPIVPVIQTDSYDDNVHQLIDALSIKIDQTLPYDWRATTLNIGQKTSKWNSEQWQKTLQQVMGVNTLQYEPWLNDSLKSFSRENVELIKSIKDKSLTDIETLSQRSLRTGKRHEEIAKQIQEQYQTTKARAKLIARDQVSKLNGQLTQLRQQDLGISQYKFQTSGDERVRRSHAAMDGKLCRWDNSTVYSDDDGKTWKSRTSIWGVELHPGQDFQCRCWAFAVFTQIQEEINKQQNIFEPILEEK